MLDAPSIPSKPRYRLVPVMPTKSATLLAVPNTKNPVLMHNPRSERELVLLPRSAEPIKKTRVLARDCTTRSHDIILAGEVPRIAPKYNTHINQVPVSGDCVCVFCSFRFVPKKSKPVDWMNDSYVGLDYCPACSGQGGIIRTRGVELAKLPQIRAAVIDLIQTQNLKSQSLASDCINPVWKTMCAR